MTEDGRSVLFGRVPTALHAKILAAAQADNRSVSKWLEQHFTEFFEKENECQTDSDSTPSVVSSSSCASPSPPT